MYVPPHNREKRIPVMHKAIESIRFGSFVTVGSEGPLVTNVPMFVDALPDPRGTIMPVPIVNGRRRTQTFQLLRSL
jgi:predicted FMN-binding regulatory protein PaiB